MHKQNTVMLLYLDIYTYQMIFILTKLSHPKQQSVNGLVPSI